MGGVQIGPLHDFKWLGLILFEESEDSSALDNPFYALFNIMDSRGNSEQIHSLNPVELLKFYLCLHPAT